MPNSIKVIIYFILGALIFNHIICILFSSAIIVFIVAFIVGWKWFGYLIRYYYPKEKVEK